MNDITSLPPEYSNPYYDPYGTMDPVLRRQYMAQAYDFSLPWNFGFNYAVNYSVAYVNNGTTGYKKNVTQTVSFNGSVNLTPKTGITFQGGYDIKGEQAHHLVDLDHARPPLLADVLLVDPLRLPQELELQHRRQGGIALRPEVRQVAVDVRQHVLIRRCGRRAAAALQIRPGMTPSETLPIHTAPFGELPTETYHRIVQAREEVFFLEQRITCPDADAIDPARSSNGSSRRGASSPSQDHPAGHPS